MLATKLSGTIGDDISADKFKREELYTKNIWYSPLYLLLLEQPLEEQLWGAFGKQYPPEKSTKDSWMPTVLGPVVDAMQAAPLNQEIIPYLRPGKETVDMRTRVTHYEACENMVPRTFPLEKEFLLWEKYQVENRKYERSRTKQPCL